MNNPLGPTPLQAGQALRNASLAEMTNRMQSLSAGIQQAQLNDPAALALAGMADSYVEVQQTGDTANALLLRGRIIERIEHMDPAAWAQMFAALEQLQNHGQPSWTLLAPRDQVVARVAAQLGRGEEKDNQPRAYAGAGSGRTQTVRRERWIKAAGVRLSDGEAQGGRAPFSPDTGLYWIEQGNAQRSRKQPEQALASYSKAAQIYEASRDFASAAHAYAGKGAILKSMRRYPEAAKAYEQAARYYRRVKRDRMAASYYREQSETLTAMGQHYAAIVALAKARLVLERVPGAATDVKLLRDLSAAMIEEYLSSEGNEVAFLQRLRALQIRLIETYRGEKEPLLEARSYGRLGETNFLLGRYNEAAIAFENAADIYERRRQPHMAGLALYKRAEALEHAGQPPEVLAQAYGRSAAAYYRAQNLKSVAHVLEHQVIYLEKIGNIDQATRVWEEIIENHQVLGNLEKELWARRSLAWMLARHHRLALAGMAMRGAAQAQLRQVEQTESIEGKRRAAAWFALSGLWMQGSGAVHQFEEDWSAALEILEGLGEQSDEGRLYWLASEVYYQAGDKEDAILLLDRAADYYLREGLSYYANVQERKGVLLKEQRRVADARRALELAREHYAHFSDFEAARRVDRLLAELKTSERPH